MDLIEKFTNTENISLEGIFKILVGKSAEQIFNSEIFLIKLQSKNLSDIEIEILDKHSIPRKLKLIQKDRIGNNVFEVELTENFEPISYKNLEYDFGINLTGLLDCNEKIVLANRIKFYAYEFLKRAYFSKYHVIEFK